jgi:hypothetical protein
MRSDSGDALGSAASSVLSLSASASVVGAATMPPGHGSLLELLNPVCMHGDDPWPPPPAGLSPRLSLQLMHLRTRMVALSDLTVHHHARVADLVRAAWAAVPNGEPHEAAALHTYVVNLYMAAAVVRRTCARVHASSTRPDSHMMGDGTECAGARHAAARHRSGHRDAAAHARVCTAAGRGLRRPWPAWRSPPGPPRRRDRQVSFACCLLWGSSFLFGLWRAMLSLLWWCGAGGRVCSCLCYLCACVRGDAHVRCTQCCGGWATRCAG